MGFSRQEYWSGLPFLLSGDLPNPGIRLKSPVLQENSFPLSHSFFFFSGEVIKFLDIYPSPFTEQALHYNPGIVPSVQFPSQEMCRLMQWDMTGLAFVLPRPRMPFSRFCMTCDPRTISISLGFPTGSKCGRTIWCQLLPTASEMAKSTSTTCRRAEVSTSCLACLLRHDTGI